MAGRAQGLPQEVGGEPLDLLDTRTSRKMVRHAAAARGTAGTAADAADFEQGEDGKLIVKVRLGCFNDATTMALSPQCNSWLHAKNSWLSLHIAWLHWQTWRQGSEIL